MAREVSRAESYEKVYEAFQTVNFSAFDFNTIKESLLDYIKLYFPEDFNDYIESSEFIAILELFAYIGEQLAYRVDMNAHENFLSTAKRKESVLRLAKLISYGPSRNIPNRGLVKIQSIQTTETVFDANGRNLAGRKIIWNDANNPDWKEQFLLVMNRVLQQTFGSVTPDDRVQVDDVLFELYSWNNSPLSTSGPQVFPYTATITEQGVPLELVPVTLTENGPEEKRPERRMPFTLLYGADGLGDASNTTGFFIYTKQGTLQKITTVFDGVTPNLTFDVNTDNINETDLFVNNIDASTGQIITDDGIQFSSGPSGLWNEVDITNAQNIIFNTNSNRRKYEVETLDSDQVRLIYGDGEFSEIPTGSFDIWFRTSINQDITIPQNTVIDKSTSFSYVNSNNGVETLTFTFSLISSLQNGSVSEDIEHIREVAPSVYYTQDRMVNARDYNTFMLQDPSIIKLLAVNRTFAGDSKFIAWNDPSQSYENVKVFGDDLALYYQEEIPSQGALSVISNPIDGNTLLINFIEPWLSSTDFFLILAPELEERNINPGLIRRTFNNDPLSFNPALKETDEIVTALNVLGVSVVNLYYSLEYDEWTVGPHPFDAAVPPAESIFMVRVEARYTGSVLSGWDIRFRTKRLVSQSQKTQFWNNNSTNQIIDFDSLTSTRDRIVVLQANVNADENGILDSDKNFDIVAQELVEQNLSNAGIPDVHRLSVLPIDNNEDGIADNLLLPILFNKNQQLVEPLPANPITIDRNYITTRAEEEIDISQTINRGFQIVNFNVPLVGTDPAYPAPVVGNIMTATFIIDGGAPIVFNTPPLTGAETYNSILTALNVSLTPSAEAVIVGSDIYIMSNSIGGSSTVSIVDGGLPNALFADMVDYSSLGVIISGNTQTKFKLIKGVNWTEQPPPVGTLLSNEINILSTIVPPVTGDIYEIIFTDFVYFTRSSSQDPWIPSKTTDELKTLFAIEDPTITNEDDRRYKRELGRYPLNFAWFHFTTQFHLVDPAASNIIDIFVITQGFLSDMRRYLDNQTNIEPALPSSLSLRTSYADLLDNKMISDTVVLHSGKFKVIFGSKAPPELQVTIKVIRPTSQNLTISLTDNEVKVRIVQVVNSFFNISTWEFGETFYFSELSAAIHRDLGTEIDSVVLVPLYQQTQFGDLYVIPAREDEILIPDMDTTDIEIVQSYTPENIRQES